MGETADRLYLSLLVVRCQVGGADAFTELVTLCQPRLRAFLYKLLANRQNIDDLAQDVWLEVFRALSRLNDPAAFLPWFYRIARNRAFRALRSNRAAVGSIDEIEAMDEHEDEPEFTAADAQAVHAAMDRLIPEHREVLLLRFIEDMSYDEIARVVDCPIGTVRSRVHNAKLRLRKIIETEMSYDAR